MKKIKIKKKSGIWFSNHESIERLSQEKAEYLQKIFENIIFYGITIPIQLFQTFGVVGIAILNNSFPELAFFLIGFFFSRSFLGETFHFNSTIICTLFTWGFFFVITIIIPNIYISVFLCLILGCFTSIYMNYLVTKEIKLCRKD